LVLLTFHLWQYQYKLRIEFLSFDELPKLAEIGCEGTIIGKAIYEGRISLKQLENYILENAN
jgi:hypothetical protein